MSFNDVNFSPRHVVLCMSIRMAKGKSNMMRKKQEKIFIEFIDQYKKRFYLLALTYTKNEQDALDVVQESLSKAWKSFPTLKDHSQLKSWFFQILVRTAIDFLRKQKKICLMEDDQIEYFSPNQVDTYTNLDLHTALNNLPYQFSEIIILRFFEDFKIEDIANILDIPLSTAKSRLYRALKLLKIELVEEAANHE